MSYAYMKALESAPERYDKGISWLGWGKLDDIRNHITDLIQNNGKKILEIGVGTGTQALLLAERGLEVIGIDHSIGMLSIAQKKLDEMKKDENGIKIVSRIELQHKAAVQLDGFQTDTFDVVTSTLVFSELQTSEQKYVLMHALRILKPGGALVLSDEVVPSKKSKKVLHSIISAILKFFTFLITQTTTKAVHNLEGEVQEAGFEIENVENFQLDSFQLILARKPIDFVNKNDDYSGLKLPLRSALSGGFGATLWQTIMRMTGHETEIGLIPIGNPTLESPVLCTCNFKLTVSRLCDLLEKKKIDAWILVAPSNGINVWCASCGDEFNAESVITAIKISSLENYVEHRTIILPQLAAPGIEPKKIKESTGWSCVWGPVDMNHIPEFLKKLPDSIRNKSEKERGIRFGLKSRLEMGSAFIFPVLLIIVVPVFLILFFLNLWVWILPVLSVAALYGYFIFSSWSFLPARLGSRKVLIGSVIFIILLFFITWLITEVFQIKILMSVSFQGLFAIFNWWPLTIETLILMGILLVDADGLTPTLRSSYGARSWNKGKLSMLERWGSAYALTPYGKIAIDIGKCTGCGNCVDVCPMLIPIIYKPNKKAILSKTETCINCNACIIQCPTRALYLESETEAAKKALKKYFSIMGEN